MNQEPNFYKKLLATVGLVLLAIIVLFVLQEVVEIFLLVFIGLIFAVVLRALSKPFTRYLGLPDMLSVFVVLLLLGLLLGGLAWFYTPRLVSQTQQFAETIPAAVSRLEDALRDLPGGEMMLDRIPPPEEISVPERVAPQVFSTVTSTLGAVGYAFFVLFVAIFLAVQPKLYREGLVKLVPPERRPRAQEVIDASLDALRAFMLGRFISMASVGVMVTVGLWVLGVPLALLLGFLAFIFDFIPNIGPFIAALPAVLFAFAEGPTLALYVALLYFGVQQIESYLITPIVQHKAVHLPPALVLIVIIVMGIMFGIPGVIAATPLMAVLLVLVRMLYVEDILGDRSHLEEENAKGARPARAK